MPPDLAGDRESTGPGLVPIPKRTLTHGERCILLAALHRKYGVDVGGTLDPDQVSFLITDKGRIQGHGPYAILIHVVEDLTDADAPVLMRMVEKVREGFWERSDDQQAAVMVAPGSDGKNSRSLVEPCPDAFTCYRASITSGMKQIELAELLTKELKRKVSQGQVSRWNKRGKEWVEAGNVLPPLP